MLAESVYIILQMCAIFLKLSGSSSFPPPLSAASEREYFERYKNGDKDARRILIEHNLRLVAHIAKKFYSPTYDNDDLISIGTIGLIKAIDSYNPNNGTRFAAYAGKCLQNEILMYFRSQRRIANESSLSEAVETDKDGNPLTYMDIICCEDNVIDEIDLKLNTEKALRAVATELDSREREIIIMRYGLLGGKAKTQREVSEKLGISRSYVSRIEKSAIEKLRNVFEK